MTNILELTFASSLPTTLTQLAGLRNSTYYHAAPTCYHLSISAATLGVFIFLLVLSPIHITDIHVYCNAFPTSPPSKSGKPKAKLKPHSFSAQPSGLSTKPEFSNMESEALYNEVWTSFLIALLKQWTTIVNCLHTGLYLAPIIFSILSTWWKFHPSTSTLKMYLNEMNYLSEFPLHIIFPYVLSTSLLDNFPYKDGLCLITLYLQREELQINCKCLMETSCFEVPCMWRFLIIRADWGISKN